MKISKTLTIASILSLASVGSAFAAATSFVDSGLISTGSPTVNIKPSKNVTVVYLASGTTSGTGVITYSISASHSSGTKTYGSSSGDTKIFMEDGTGGTPPDAPATGVSAAFGTGWTAL